VNDCDNATSLAFAAVAGAVATYGGIKIAGAGKGASAISCNSFSPDTKVLLADGKSKAIKDVEKGDVVEAADPRTGHDQGPQRVTATMVHRDDNLVDLTIRTSDGRLSVLHTTTEHPFWDATLHAWADAIDLVPGHHLGALSDSSATIAAIKVIPGDADRYNLTVQHLHTYYVIAGATPVLVHNGGQPGPGQIYLWRTVTASELADIQANRTWNSPQGIKYFSFTEKGAAEYSRRAYGAYPEEGPYTMIRTTVNVADLPEGARMAYTADVVDGGVALNNDELKILGRPAIMPSVSTSVSCG
jgi:hypothetical protein